jgi:hypothetical protein
MNKNNVRDVKLEEILWTKIPDWECPRCRFINKAIRSRCRNFECGAPRPESVLIEAKRVLSEKVEA